MYTFRITRFLQECSNLTDILLPCKDQFANLLLPIWQNFTSMYCDDSICATVEPCKDKATGAHRGICYDTESSPGYKCICYDGYGGINCTQGKHMTSNDIFLVDMNF